jgi:hypothetical protein
MEALPPSAGGGPSTGVVVASLILLLLLFFIYQILIARPRSKGGAAGPPLVTASPICTIPVIGTIIEFGQSPVKMVSRCYEQYGPVFTVPVSVCV